MGIGDRPASIELEHLSKLYKGPKRTTITAVEDLTLSVEKGQVFGVLGANGAGKTTIIKMICGLVTPTTGHILLNGYDVKAQRGQAAGQIGAVLEGTRNVYWRLSAWNNLMYFGRLKGGRGRKLLERAEQLLKELDLWDRRNQPIRFFSRGMQQKVAVACALVSDPPIVLLDEPTLGLDIQTTILMKNWIARLANEEGKTVILTTHQLDIAQYLCKQIAIMYKGQILANKPLNELLFLFEKNRYQIKVRGEISARQWEYLEGWTKTCVDGETRLDGLLDSQEELYHLLDLLREWKLTLLAVNKKEPDLEQVFIQMISDKKEETRDELDLVSHR